MPPRRASLSGLFPPNPTCDIAQLALSLHPGVMSEGWGKGGEEAAAPSAHLLMLLSLSLSLEEGLPSTASTHLHDL